jgi:hypothetical protein
MSCVGAKVRGILEVAASASARVNNTVTRRRSIRGPFPSMWVLRDPSSRSKHAAHALLEKARGAAGERGKIGGMAALPADSIIG